MQAVGIDLGGTNIKSALIDKQNGIIKQFSIPTEADQGVDHVFDQLAKVIKQASGFAEEQVCGVGVGSPGTISLDRTTVSYPPNLPGWEVENLAERLFSLTGLRTRVENDANLAALGSSRFGAGREFDNMIMLTLGTGVGGGIIINNELYRGTTGGAAELGHVIINFDGPKSQGKTRGSIEAYLGQRFLSRNASDKILEHEDNPLYQKFVNDFSKLEPIDLYMEAKKGNDLATEILSEAGRMLGYAIVNYIHVLDIRSVVVGGGVAKAGEFILQPARDAVQEQLMPSFLEGFSLSYEELGNDVALLGAASLAFNYFGK